MILLTNEFKCQIRFVESVLSEHRERSVVISVVLKLSRIMAATILCFRILTIITMVYAANFPYGYNAVKDNLAGEERPWSWSSSAGRRLKFDSEHDDFIENHERAPCQHIYIHFGPTKHHHYHYRGGMEYYSHVPFSYPHLDQFGKGFPTSDDVTTRSPAPVFEEIDEDPISNVVLKPSTTTTRATTKPTTTATTTVKSSTSSSIILKTTPSSSSNQIDLRFGA